MEAAVAALADQNGALIVAAPTRLAPQITVHQLTNDEATALPSKAPDDLRRHSRL